MTNNNDRRHQHEVDSGPADETEEGRQAWFRSMWESDVSGKPTDNEEEEEDHPVEHDADQGNDHDDDDGFGDDFDDFAEGEGDADFGDFDEAESIPSQTQETQQPRSNIPPAPDILADLVSSLSIHTTPISQPLTSLPFFHFHY